jgi:hypothetical protein
LRCRAGEETREKTVFLSFDDGPPERTAEILDILKEYGIKATFFIIGKKCGHRARAGVSPAVLWTWATRWGSIRIRMSTRDLRLRFGLLDDFYEKYR